MQRHVPTVHAAALFALLCASVCDAAPNATPTASASPKVLKTIGRVRALSPFCAKAVAHADSAITGALDNDTRIAFTISNLKTVDLDSSPVMKSNGTRQLVSQYATIRETTSAAQAQVRLLRADADAATDPDQKAELRAFADALGGAIERQQKMAEELSRTIAYVDAHPPIDQNQKAQFLFDIQWAQSLPYNPYHGDPQDYVPPTLSEVARAAGDRLTTEEPDVAADEGRAAGRVDTAFKGCM